MEEEQQPQYVSFTDIKRHEEKSRKVLDEIYTRLDNARLQGLDLNKRRDNSPLRTEDEVGENEQEHLDFLLKSTAQEAQNRSFDTPEIKNIPFYEFTKNGIQIRSAMEHNEESKNRLGADTIYTTTLNGRKITLKTITINGTVTHALDVIFPDDDDFEGLSYHSSDTKNGRLNSEDYAIASYVLSKAIHEVYDVNPKS